MNTTLTNRDWMEISAYLDEQLAPVQRVKLEQRLQVEPALRNALEEIRRLRLMLRSLKPRKVPHNFTLTHQMALERKRNPLVPWLGWSSVLSSLLLIFSLLLRMNLSFGASAPTMMKESQASMDQASTGRQMPMIIQWAGPIGSGGGGQMPSSLGLGGSPGMPAVEGKGGGGGTPDYSANQPPFIGFPLPGTDVTTAEDVQQNTQMRVLEQPGEMNTQVVGVMATQMPAAQSAAPSVVEQEPASKAMQPGGAAILGLPPVEEQGSMRVLEVTRNTAEVQSGQPSAVLIGIKEWWLSVLLLVLAGGSGATALLLRRKRL
jgi:anti-sigma factor RsiW